VTDLRRPTGYVGRGAGRPEVSSKHRVSQRAVALEQLLSLQKLAPDQAIGSLGPETCYVKVTMLSDDVAEYSHAHVVGNSYLSRLPRYLLSVAPASGEAPPRHR
jgi:hypothetical protein